MVDLYPQTGSLGPWDNESKPILGNFDISI